MKKTLLLFLIIVPSFTYSQITQNWLSIYNRPRANVSNVAAAMCIDNAGRIFGAGYSGPSGHESYLLIRYNPINGDTLWTRKYNNGGQNILTAMDVDSNNNVYVTGYSFNSPGFDFYTIKYSSQGVQKWAARYHGVSNAEDRPAKLKIDANGDVYVAGYSSVNGFHNFCVVKYDSSGVQKSAVDYKRTNDNYEATGIAADNANGVYVTGITPDSSFLTVKFSKATGDTVWTRRYKDLPPYGENSGFIGCDTSGVYVSGTQSGNFFTSGDNVLIIKYSFSGNVLWLDSRRSQPRTMEKVNNMTVYQNGNIFVTGQTTPSGSANPTEYYTVRYNRNGGASEYEYLLNNYAYADAVAFDNSNNKLYVTGHKIHPGSLYDIVTFSNTDSISYGRAVPFTYNVPVSVAFDPSHNFYVFGSISGIAGFDSRKDIILIKYSNTSIGPAENNNGQPLTHSLFQNYPNPFNPSTNIDFHVASFGLIKLVVYNIAGQQVAQLVSKELQAGNYTAEFKGDNLPSGIYFYRLTSDGQEIDSRKMVLVK